MSDGTLGKGHQIAQGLVASSLPLVTGQFYIHTGAVLGLLPTFSPRNSAGKYIAFPVSK